jgi:hypothetical protein
VLCDKGRLWGAWYISAQGKPLPLFLTGDDDLLYHPMTANGQRKGDMATRPTELCLGVRSEVRLVLCSVAYMVLEE